MTTGPDHVPASESSERPARSVRIRRRVARIVIVADTVVLIVALFWLGSVDILEHPGLVRTVWITVAVFLVAFPLVGWNDPGIRPGGRGPEGRD